MATQNIAVKLCGILQSKSGEEVTAREWRLLGQEQDGSQLLSWLSKNKDSREVLNLGVYTNKTKTLTPLYEFLDKPNIIQASVNASHSLLVYVVKQLPMLGSDQQPLYCPYLVSLLPDNKEGPLEVEEGSTKQIMLQYVYGKANKYSPGIRNDRFVLFKHLEYIKIYRTPMFLNELDDGTDKWSFDGIWPDPETIVNVFTWAQWDCVNQVLYYIHYRATQASFAEGEVPPSPPEPTPTLSALQFHARLPHETVLNIPLSLGHAGSMEGACGEYEDDPIPLRVHDCSLDLQILCDQRGILCVCHHYLYKPLDDSTTSLVLEDSADLKESGVNFACSITLLQHGCVVHSVVPDLPWVLAKSLRPSYLLYSENHLLVNIPQLYTHLIDISLYHEPCCHVVIPSEDESRPALAPIIGWGPHAMVNLKTLDVVTVSVAEKDLAATFRSNTSTDNRLSILHYLIQHEGNLELAEELIGKLCLSRTGLACVQRCLQQYLVGATYCATRRALPAAAVPLVAMLPFTVAVRLGEMQVGSGQSVCVSQEAVWQVAAVVLAPRQRVCQFAEDVWTRVWTRLAAPPPARMRVAGAAERLQRTLHCYQPEALSRCSTPLSPAGPARRGSLGGADLLPFVELDECTASKQEHVVAANLRSVSVHLMRSARGADAGAHALATRWAAAQLDAARALCRALCRTMHALPAAHQHRGFAFIDEMDPKHAYLLFKVLEQYYLAADSIAFPLPQGFTSFFTYLGYRTMPFHAFVMHVHRNVFELQIDVMKAIVADKDDTKQSVNNKLRLIQLCGEGRAKRALSAWSHRAALTVRAREHAGALLAGAPARTADTARHRAPGDDGIAALPNGERLSPLDTFLDLLTAKASLNELDFNLIIEATLASVQQENAA